MNERLHLRTLDDLMKCILHRHDHLFQQGTEKTKGTYLQGTDLIGPIGRYWKTLGLAGLNAIRKTCNISVVVV